MKINVIILFVVITVATTFGQIGLESNLGDNGTYLRLKNTGIFTSGMTMGLNYINTYDPQTATPDVLKLQSDGNGNVTIGITDATGTNASDARLTVRAANDANMDLRLEGNGNMSSQGSIILHVDDNNTAIDAFEIRESTGGITMMKISEDLKHFIFGDLAVGSPTHATGYRMSVDGKIMAEEVRVELSQNWPDYVFKPDYKLMPLDELSDEIKVLGHLPGVPAAHVVETDGFDLGEMNRILLEKVEELTLHIIDLNQQVQELKK